MKLENFVGEKMPENQMSEIKGGRKPPRGNNYIENGHLYVWYEDHYIDMGEYDPGP